MSSPESEPRTIDERRAHIHTLALKRLQEIETELREKYNRGLFCGMELEFNFRDHMGQMPTVAIQSWRYNEEPTSLVRKDKTNSFVASPYVEEFGPDGEPWQRCYEFKISGLRKHKGVVTADSQPSTIARVTDRIRTFVEKKTPEMFQGQQAEFMAADPINTDETADLHVNLSVWDKDYQKPLLHEMSINNTIAMQKLLFPIAIESRNSFERFGRHPNVPSEFRCNSENKYGNSLGYRTITETAESRRFEDRLYGADVDPALAALVSVCAAYWTIKTKEPNVTKALPLSDAISCTNYIPTTLTDYQPFLEHLEQSDVAKELLGNELFHELTTLRRDQYKAMCKSSNVEKKVEYHGKLDTAAMRRA